MAVATRHVLFEHHRSLELWEIRRCGIRTVDPDLGDGLVALPCGRPASVIVTLRVSDAYARTFGRIYDERRRAGGVELLEMPICRQCLRRPRRMP